MPIPRITAHAPLHRRDAEWGYQLGGEFADLEAISLAHDGGATFSRVHPGWDSVENYDTGVRTLPNGWGAALSAYAAAGMKPVIVAAYGPPRKNVATLTLTEDAAIGVVTLSVSGSLNLAEWPYCFVQKTDNSQIVASGRWAYYGAIIDSVNIGAGTITLAAPTTVTLAIGTQLKMNRLKYAPITSNDPQQEGAVAFRNYAVWLAQQIASAGCQGYVCLWNEPAWENDHWTEPHAWYVTPPAEWTATRMKALLLACLEVELPDGVRFISGATDKSGANGLVNQDALTGPVARLSIPLESIHPYGLNPEKSAFDRQFLSSATSYQHLLDQDSTGNFKGLAKRQDDFRATYGFGPRIICGETGASIADDTRQAISLLRRVLCWWGLGIPTIFYALSGGIQDYNAAPGLVPRPSYFALQRMTELLDRLDSDSPVGNPGAVPTILGWAADGIYPMTVAIYGDSGHAILFAWNRTYDEVGSWPDLTPPTPLSLTLSKPVGVQIAETIRVRTGESITPTIGATTITVDIDDDPIAIRLEPAA